MLSCICHKYGTTIFKHVATHPQKSTKPTDLAINNERSFPIIKSINFPANHWIMSLILKEYGFRNVEINGKLKEKERMAQSACAKNILVNKYRYEICRANGNTYIILK